MNKKVISVALAAVMAVSASAICASADEVKVEKSGTSGTFTFDPGDWNSNKVCFYIWDTSTTPTTYATKDGWVEENTWGSKKKTGGTKQDDGTFESFELEIPDGHEVYVIFFDPDLGAQTFDCVLTGDAIGDKAVRTGEMLENPVDSEKQAEAVRFENSGLTAKLCVTSSGKIQGSTITPQMNCAKEVATFVFTYLGQTEKLSGEQIITEDSVANAISAFQTDADSVWAEYQTFEGQEGYNPDEAKKFIKPSGSDDATETDSEKKDDTKSSDEDDDDDESKTSTSSKSSTTTSSASTASKSSTTTTTTTTGTTTTGTASTEAAAETGDTTNTAAFAVVLLAAAAAMFFARKKVED
jgi:LPXTG-motif cell wall-anchored protein